MTKKNQKQTMPKKVKIKDGADITTWNLETMDMVEEEDKELSCILDEFTKKYKSRLIEKYLLKGITEVINLAIEDGVHIDFITNPLMLRINLPLGAIKFEGPTFTLNIKEYIEEEIEHISSHDTRVIDGSSEEAGCQGEWEHAKSLRDNLREIADLIDKNMAKEPRKS